MSKELQTGLLLVVVSDSDDFPKSSNEPPTSLELDTIFRQLRRLWTTFPNMLWVLCSPKQIDEPSVTTDL